MTTAQRKAARAAAQTHKNMIAMSRRQSAAAELLRQIKAAAHTAEAHYQQATRDFEVTDKAFRSAYQAAVKMKAGPNHFPKYYSKYV